MSCLNCAKYYQLVSDYSYLQKKYAELKSERGWIRCEDALPQEEGDYLVYMPICERLCLVGHYEGIQVQEFCDRSFMSDKVTHWMNLPNGPE